MLTRLIVDVYAWIIEIALWFMLLVSGVAGYYYTVQILEAVGLIPENQAMWRIFGALGFAVATFLVTAIFTGPVLVLVDIRKSLKILETKNNSSSSKVPPVERREPSA